MGALAALSYTRPAMAVACLYVLILLTVPAASWAQSAPPQPPAPTQRDAEFGPEDAAPAPAHKPATPLDLDRLLRPPGVVTSAPSAEPTYGGRDRTAWRDEFQRANLEVADLEAKVEVSQNRLRQTATGDWNYSPAGGQATDPEVLKLRAQLRRDRQSLETSRQRLRDLRVEASLAGVPEVWLKP